MRSRHVDEFNHDEWAAEYDADVRNESDPSRTGYADVLRWTVERAQITPDSCVVDLGSGTGNTSTLIQSAGRVTCVDISQKMTELARPKLAHLPSVEYVRADLLEFFEEPRAFDRLVSTYAVHHLTEDEKALLLEQVGRSLSPGGIAVFGDLMFENAAGAAEMAEKYTDWPEVVQSFEEEHFWHVDGVYAMADAAGLSVTDVRRFSDLSWGIRLERASGTASPG